ncbi:nicotinate-nucleotide--dimethylbenzimidazole phosphoribosyltransferase [Salaquimonas pukyongi]|uniref:nicotinate-nucleotide--dimethylbenzimidazole phosphoribosyltransferase n=1 Tax=Salaquimonas pukyongi TaxID=2712698 RepID=UPI00096BB1C8|nr:nicotinate-nucleotide--dimethylbenzimidazole phosphoribosyltransferase [Salaquimonas pukyongi]
MALSGLPFDDIRTLIAGLPEADKAAHRLAVARSEVLIEHLGAMHREAELAAWLAAWSGKSPRAERPLLALFAGTHGAAEHSLQEDTIATVTRLAAGGSAVNQICAGQDIGLKVFDLALQIPVGDVCTTEAMDEKGCAGTIGFGMEAIAGGVDLLGLAAFGRGGEIADAALIELVGGQDREVALSHAGINPAGECAKQVETALAHHGAASDPLELLRRLGGREHSAIAGAILAARVNHVPVVLGGTRALVVALLLENITKGACAHCAVAGGEAAGLAGLVAKACGMPHLLSGFGLSGEGLQAALAMALARAVAAAHEGFSESV